MSSLFCLVYGSHFVTVCMLTLVWMPFIKAHLPVVFRSDPAGGQSCQWNSIHHSTPASNVAAADAAWRCAGPRHTAGLCFILHLTQQWHVCSSSVTAGCVVTASTHLMSGICFPESAEVLIIASQCRKSVRCLARLKCNIRTDGGRFYWKRTGGSREGFTIAGLLQWFMKDDVH